MDFVPTLLGGVLLWDFCTRIMQGVSTAFLEDVWSRNFLNLFSSPLSISEYIMGLVITSVATGSIGLIVMLLLATGLFHLQFFSMGLPLARLPAGAVRVRHLSRHLRKRHRAQARTRIGVAAVALAGAALALRGRVLPPRRSAALDAAGFPCAAAGLCVRGNARAAGGRMFPAGLLGAGIHGVCARIAACLPFLRTGCIVVRCARACSRATAPKAWDEGSRRPRRGRSAGGNGSFPGFAQGLTARIQRPLADGPQHFPRQRGIPHGARHHQCARRAC